MDKSSGLSSLSSVMSEANFSSVGSNQTYLVNLAGPLRGVLIAFQLGRLLCILCIIFGIIGNTALVFVVIRSSFHRLSHGVLLLFIALLDIVRLLSTTFYYLLFEDLIPLNLATMTMYIVSYRYPKNVTNWLKVVLAIDRIVTVKFWLSHPRNIHSKKINTRQRRRILRSIGILLICSLISQHPNFLSDRFVSPQFDRTRFLLTATINPTFHYGGLVYDGTLYTIVSYILLDDLLPVAIMILLNMYLLYQLRRLPVMTSRKLGESIWILFCLTIFSVFVAPRSFIFLCDLYINQKYINRTAITILFHALQGRGTPSTSYSCYCFP